jgi:hypothetical protein
VLDILYFLYFSKGEEDIPIGIPMTDTVFVVFLQAERQPYVG